MCRVWAVRVDGQGTVGGLGIAQRARGKQLVMNLKRASEHGPEGSQPPPAARCRRGVDGKWMEPRQEFGQRSLMERDRHES